MTDRGETSTTTASAIGRRRRVVGVLLALAGHALAVTVAFIVLHVGTDKDLGALTATVAAFELTELLVFIICVVVVSDRRTRDIGEGLFLGWLGVWLVAVGLSVSTT